MSVPAAPSAATSVRLPRCCGRGSSLRSLLLAVCRLFADRVFFGLSAVLGSQADKALLRGL
jgi:hypothetical protein